MGRKKQCRNGLLEDGKCIEFSRSGSLTEPCIDSCNSIHYMCIQNACRKVCERPEKLNLISNPRYYQNCELLEGVLVEKIKCKYSFQCNRADEFCNRKTEKCEPKVSGNMCPTQYEGSFDVCNKDVLSICISGTCKAICQADLDCKDGEECKKFTRLDKSEYSICALKENNSVFTAITASVTVSVFIIILGISITAFCVWKKRKRRLQAVPINPHSETFTVSPSQMPSAFIDKNEMFDVEPDHELPVYSEIISGEVAIHEKR